MLSIVNCLFFVSIDSAKIQCCLKVCRTKKEVFFKFSSFICVAKMLHNVLIIS
jgi:hypothetical protein